MLAIRIKSLLAGLVLALASTAQADITVTALGEIKKDAAGLLSEGVSGIPKTFWADSNPKRLAELMPRYTPGALPEAKSLLMRISLAQLTPPIGAENDRSLLDARIDYLFSAGALDQAEALLAIAGVDAPDLFERWFNVNLLLRQPDRACSPVADKPSLATQLPMRVFCLAQNGDWNSAEVALSLGLTLGQITPEEFDLLGEYLDREEFEGQTVPASANITPLTFYLRHEMGQPVRTRSIPLPYLSYLLAGFESWRDRILAAERLTAAGVTTPDYLFSIYKDGVPSASGGVWDRVRSVQDLYEEFSAMDPENLKPVLDEAWDQLASRDLLPALADIVLNRAEDFHTGTDGGARLLHLLLLSPDENAAAALIEFLPPSNPIRAVFYEDFSTLPSGSPLVEAIRRGFSDLPLSSQRASMISDRRLGEAVLLSLSDLAEGPASDPVKITESLKSLMRAGFAPEARRLALQLLIFQDL